ncbi:MAG: pknB 16 [Planctomycetaceae bacterium]|nr:pknB 16 [Planctomycetaceae bacterium]
MTDESPVSPLPVERLKQYQLIRLVGRGIRSAVYEARDFELDRIVAIKLLNSELASDLSQAKRFFSQAAAAARILHPNIVPIYYVGQDGPHCFCVREFVDGTSLEQRLVNGDRFTELTALTVACQILQGLVATESLGMSHGNLHARNVLFDQSGSRVLLSDLQAESPVERDGVPAEAASSEPPPINADLASVGLLLRSMLPSDPDQSSPRPHSPESSGELSPAISKQVEALLERLTGNDRSVPFRSAKEALDAVQSLIDIKVPANEHHGSVVEPAIVANPRSQAGDNEFLAFQDLGADPELPLGLFAAEQSNFWRRCCHWMAQQLGFGSPENPQRVKDTQAAVDGVLVEMQRRLRELNRLAQEGEDILRDLQLQIDRPASVDGDHGDRATLAASISAQQRQVDEIKRRQSELHRKVQGLTAQRDALHARLLVAESQGAKSDRPKSANRTLKTVSLVAKIGLILGLFSYAGYLISQMDDFKRFRTRIAAQVEAVKRASQFPVGSFNRTREPDHAWIPAELTAVPLRVLRVAGEYPTHSLSFCPGRSIVAGGSEDGVMRVWAVESGLEISRSVHFLFQSAADVTSAVFNSDGRSVAIGISGRGQCLMLWDLATGRVLKKMQGDNNGITSTSFTSDGRFLAVATHERIPGKDPIFHGKGIVVLFDVQTGALLERVPTDNVDVTHVKCSPTGSLVAFIGGDQPIQIWDVKQRQIVHRLTGHGETLNCLAFSADGRQVAAGDFKGGISVWTLGQDDQPVRLPSPAPPAYAYPIKGVAFSADGQVLAGIGGGFVALWDHAQKNVLRYLITDHDQLEFSGDGRFLVTAGIDRLVTRWQRDATGNRTRPRKPESIPPLVWDASDLSVLLKRPPQKKVNQTPRAGSVTPPETANDALRQLRHLVITEQERPREWQEYLKVAAPSFPIINVDVGDSPARWQEVTLNTSKTGFDGIRFTSPLDGPADLHWSFHSPPGMASWMIGSPAGPIEGFKHFWHEHNLTIPEVPVPEYNTFYFQRYEGGQILPGREYVIWFNFLSQDPIPVRLALHLRKARGEPLNPVPETSATEIRQAMGWDFPLQYSGVSDAQVEKNFIRPQDLFNFQPVLPFSQERYPSVLVRHYQVHEE